MIINNQREVLSSIIFKVVLLINPYLFPEIMSIKFLTVPCLLHITQPPWSHLFMHQQLIPKYHEVIPHPFLSAVMHSLRIIGWSVLVTKTTSHPSNLFTLEINVQLLLHIASFFVIFVITFIASLNYDNIWQNPAQYFHFALIISYVAKIIPAL